MDVYKNKQWLEETYAEYKSIYKVADLAGCSPRTIHNWLIKYGIPRVGNIERHQSLETREKIGMKSKGKKPMLGKKHSKETKELMSKARKGEGNPNWKGGVTEKIRRFRRTKEYVSWVKAVLERAEYKCEECGSTENVEAHHIISLYTDFSKGLDLDNGQALCKKCHKKKDWRKKQNE
jgi:hypothetical protein